MQNLSGQFVTNFNDFVGIFTNKIFGFSGASFNLVTIVFLVVLLAVFLLGLTFGRSRVLIGLLSLYVAKLLESNFIYFDWINDLVSGFPQRWLHFSLFLLFAMVVFVLIQLAASRRLSQADSSILAVTVLSFLSAGFLASVMLSYLPAELYQDISPDILKYFTSQTAQFWWSVAPLISLVFMKK